MLGYSRMLKKNTDNAILLSDDAILLSDEEKNILFSGKVDVSDEDLKEYSEIQKENAKIIDIILDRKSSVLLLHEKFKTPKFRISSFLFLLLLVGLMLLGSLSLFFPIFVLVIGSMTILTLSSIYEDSVGEFLNVGEVVAEVLFVELWGKSLHDASVHELMDLLNLLTQNKDIQENKDVLKLFIESKSNSGYNVKLVLYQMCAFYALKLLKKNPNKYPGIENIAKVYRKCYLNYKKSLLN